MRPLSANKKKSVLEGILHPGANSADPLYVKLLPNLRNFYVCSAPGIGAISSWLKHTVIYQLNVLKRMLPR